MSQNYQGEIIVHLQFDIIGFLRSPLTDSDSLEKNHTARSSYLFKMFRNQLIVWLKMHFNVKMNRDFLNLLLNAIVGEYF